MRPEPGSRRGYTALVVHSAFLILNVAASVFIRAAAGAEPLPPPLPHFALAANEAARATAVSGVAPVLAPPASMRVTVGDVADQALHATDADGDSLTFFKGSGPPYMVVTTTDPGTGSATGNIHLTPPVGTPLGATTASVAVIDGVLGDQKTFTIIVSTIPPVLEQLQNMRLTEGTTADQGLFATDADGDRLTFSRISGPSFVTVTTTSDSTGNVHLAPGLTAAGTYSVTVAASDGIASDKKSFQVIVDSSDKPPVLEPVADMSVSAGGVADQAVTASDAEGQPLMFHRDSGPAYMTVSTLDPGAGLARGNIHLAPSVRDAPTADEGAIASAAGVSVTDGTSWDVRSFSIETYFPADNPPVLQQPADMVVDEVATATQSLIASDPDGEWIYLRAVVGPSFMTMPFFGIKLTPAYADAGHYTATLEVKDTRGLSDEKSFEITVNDVNAPPALERPVDMIGFAEGTTEQELHASDVDGTPLTFSKVAGPDYMTVWTSDPGSGHATGIVRLAPGDVDVGTSRGQIQVSDGLLTAYTYWNGFRIEVYPAGAPALVKTGDICLHRGSVRSIAIVAIDLDGDRLSFSQTGLPSFGNFVDNGDNTATLVLAPPLSEPLGTHPMVVRVGDGTFTDRDSITVGVASACPGETIWNPPFASGGENHPPAVVAGGPYEGMVGVPISFDGTSSSDPDGQALSYTWYLGDGSIASGPATSHAYEQSGHYPVVLRVSDGGLTGQALTSAVVANPLPARAFAPPGHTTVRLKTGTPELCVQIEPVGQSYRNDDVDLSSIVMKSPGTGSASQVSALAGSRLIGDRDGNGIEEIQACIGKADLRRLFGSIAGQAQVTATLEGRILPAGLFRAKMDLVVMGDKAAGAVSVSPNPLNPEATLTFDITTPGRVDVRVYDVAGRLVRTVVAGESMPADTHDVRIDGRDSKGRKLASGVYFYRIESPDGVTTGRFAIMK